MHPTTFLCKVAWMNRKVSYVCEICFFTFLTKMILLFQERSQRVTHTLIVASYEWDIWSSWHLWLVTVLPKSRVGHEHCYKADPCDWFGQARMGHELF